jgi:hypothetical protein
VLVLFALDRKSKKWESKQESPSAVVAPKPKSPAMNVWSSKERNILTASS